MLNLSNIGKRYGDVLVLHRVSLTVNHSERVGLVGPNGCGKTTLLKVITGEEQPDAGAVSTAPGLRMGYLQQGLTYDDNETLGEVLRPHQNAIESAEARIVKLSTALASAAGEEQSRLLEAYGEALSEMERLLERQIPEHAAEAVLAGLGLADLPLDMPIAYLSGGQKTRLGLARLLIQDPHVLLLDEPTNHLDIAALEWLESWLQDYAGAALIVSHDRTFLNRTVNVILELDPELHTATSYPGNYDDYLDAKEREMEKHWEAYNSQQERIEQMMNGIRHLSGYAERIEQGTIDFSVRKVAKGIARRAVVQKRRLERELAEETIEKPTPTWQMKLEFEQMPQSGQDVLILKDLALGYDGQPLLAEVNTFLRQGERIALIGPNGTGKTTLLRAIAGTLAPLSGEIRRGTNLKMGYYAQEQENLDPKSTPFETIRRVAAMSDTDVRSFLHYFLFSGDDVFVPNRSLSYGERARLALARMVATGCNFLLLDEPINHLDIPSRSNFERAMTGESGFEGTVLAVVHDRYFIERFATRIWAVENGTLKSYVDLEDYQRLRKRVA